MLTNYQKEFLEKIISIPSVGGIQEEGAPYGRQPKEVLDVFLAEAERNGFNTGIVGDRVGWVEFGAGDRLIGIICHLDVVPVSDGWNSDPFTLTNAVDDMGVEAMYARGIVDDKGPACASYFAMKELFDSDFNPDGCRVRLILGTDEERTCSCIQYYAEHGEIPDFAITPDAVFPVIYSEKRIVHLRVHGENKNNLKAQGGSAVNIVPNSAYCIIDEQKYEQKGRAFHASKPENGINAITLLAEKVEGDGINVDDYPILKYIRDFDKADYITSLNERELNNITFNIGTLTASNKECEVEIDCRMPASVDCNAFINCIKEKASLYDLSTDVTLNLAPLTKDKDSPEVKKLSAIWERHIDKFVGYKEEYRNIHLEPKAVGVGTYARHIPNTIAFGIQAPWQIDQCHQANEHVAVSDFIEWIEIIKEYIIEFVTINLRGDKQV